MKKHRLLKLADELEKDARWAATGIRFNMSSWGWVHDPKEPMSCGTNACAMGLAAISGAFKNQGLTWDTRANDFRYRSPAGDYCYDGFEIAQDLFEISDQDSRYLFSSRHYFHQVGKDVEREVAKRIRDFVASDGKYDSSGDPMLQLVASHPR